MIVSAYWKYRSFLAGFRLNLCSGSCLISGRVNFSIHAIVCPLRAVVTAMGGSSGFDVNGVFQYASGAFSAKPATGSLSSAQAKGEHHERMLRPMEDLRRQQLRSLQSAALPVSASTRCIPCERESKPEKQSRKSAPQGGVQKNREVWSR